MKDFVTALGLVLVIEGVIYALLPGMMRRFNAQVALMPAATLRYAGLAAACLGVGAIWLIRG